MQINSAGIELIRHYEGEELVNKFEPKSESLPNGGMAYLYKIENKTNGKVYIGTTLSIDRRFYEHKKSSTALGKAIQEEGESNFDFSVLAIGEPGYIASLELQAIDLFNALKPCGYNHARRVNNSILDQSIRDKISRANKGRKLTEEQIAKRTQSQTGVKRSEETKRRISEAKRGYKYSDEARSKMSAANKGRKHSQETKAKIAAANTGKKRSAESRARMSAAKKASAAIKSGTFSSTPGEGV